MLEGLRGFWRLFRLEQRWRRLPATRRTIGEGGDAMYERLASDVDLEEEAEIRGLEGPLPAVVPTVMGVEAGRTTLEAAVRAGAIIVETAFVGGGGRGDDGRGPAEVLRTPECNRTRVPGRRPGSATYTVHVRSRNGGRVSGGHVHCAAVVIRVRHGDGG